MGRILALDYGKVRCGLAVSDPLKMIANGLDTVGRKDLNDELSRLLKEYEIERLVIGEPKRHSGESSEVERDIQKLIRTLQSNHPDLPISRMDERFTSKMAMDAMITMGATRKQRQQKGNIDKISATLILQDYLNNPLT